MLALVMVVRNEAGLLPYHLAYHHALGVERAYLFLDRCTDHTEAIARSFSWVRVFHRDRPAIVRYWSQHQVTCVNEGLAAAAADGVAWLMHIDADEFANGDLRPDGWRALCGNGRDPAVMLRRASLTALLTRTDAKADVVRLPQREVVLTPDLPDAPFYAQTYFLRRDTLRRDLLDPTTGEVRRVTRALGTTMSRPKSIVRVGRGLTATTSHSFAYPDGSLHHEVTDGRLYHFPFHSAATWRAKYARFAEYPAQWEKGTPVRFPKQAWKESAPTMSLAEAQVYFARWLVMRPSDLWWAQLRYAVMRDTFLRDAFAVLDIPTL